MSKSDKNEEPEFDAEERLRMENEIEKLKLSAFHGAEFSSKSELPPEIESQWLKYISQFEQQWEDAEQISVAERLGNPEFPPVEELSEKEIEENLEKIQDLMAENGLFLDAIVEVPAAELYRFIIDELFRHEIVDMDIEGLATHFIYEEFHPNDELDIEQTVTDFIRQMLSHDFRDYLDMHLADTCKTTSGEPITKENAVERAYTYGDMYDHFMIDTLEDFQINIDEAEKEASVQFHISYRATSGENVNRFEDTARAKLVKGNLGYWNIVTFRMPGFSF